MAEPWLALGGPQLWERLADLISSKFLANSDGSTAGPLGQDEDLLPTALAQPLLRALLEARRAERRSEQGLGQGPSGLEAATLVATRTQIFGDEAPSRVGAGGETGDGDEAKGAPVPAPTAAPALAAAPAPAAAAGGQSPRQLVGIKRSAADASLEDDGASTLRARRPHLASVPTASVNAAPAPTLFAWSTPSGGSLPSGDASAPGAAAHPLLLPALSMSDLPTGLAQSAKTMAVGGGLELFVPPVPVVNVIPPLATRTERARTLLYLAAQMILVARPWSTSSLSLTCTRDERASSHHHTHNAHHAPHAHHHSLHHAHHHNHHTHHHRHHNRSHHRASRTLSGLPVLRPYRADPLRPQPHTQSLPQSLLAAGGVAAPHREGSLAAAGAAVGGLPAGASAGGKAGIAGRVRVGSDASWPLGVASSSGNNGAEAFLTSVAGDVDVASPSVGGRFAYSTLDNRPWGDVLCRCGDVDAGDDVAYLRPAKPGFGGNLVATNISVAARLSASARDALAANAAAPRQQQHQESYPGSPSQQLPPSASSSWSSSWRAAGPRPQSQCSRCRHCGAPFPSANLTPVLARLRPTSSHADLAQATSVGLIGNLTQPVITRISEAAAEAEAQAWLQPFMHALRMPEPVMSLAEVRPSALAWEDQAAIIRCMLDIAVLVLPTAMRSLAGDVVRDTSTFGASAATASSSDDVVDGADASSVAAVRLRGASLAWSEAASDPADSPRSTYSRRVAGGRELPAMFEGGITEALATTPALLAAWLVAILRSALSAGFAAELVYDCAMRCPADIEIMTSDPSLGLPTLAVKPAPASDSTAFFSPTLPPQPTRNHQQHQQHQQQGRPRTLSTTSTMPFDLSANTALPPSPVPSRMDSGSGRVGPSDGDSTVVSFVSAALAYLCTLITAKPDVLHRHFPHRILRGSLGGDDGIANQRGGAMPSALALAAAASRATALSSSAVGTPEELRNAFPDGIARPFAPGGAVNKDVYVSLVPLYCQVAEDTVTFLMSSRYGPAQALALLRCSTHITSSPPTQPALASAASLSSATTTFSSAAEAASGLPQKDSHRISLCALTPTLSSLFHVGSSVSGLSDDESEDDTPVGRINSISPSAARNRSGVDDASAFLHGLSDHISGVLCVLSDAAKTAGEWSLANAKAHDGRGVDEATASLGIDEGSLAEVLERVLEACDALCSLFAQLVSFAKTVGAEAERKSRFGGGAVAGDDRQRMLRAAVLCTTTGGIVAARVQQLCAMLDTSAPISGEAVARIRIPTLAVIIRRWLPALHTAAASLTGVSPLDQVLAQVERLASQSLPTLTSTSLHGGLRKCLVSLALLVCSGVGVVALACTAAVDVVHGSAASVPLLLRTRSAGFWQRATEACITVGAAGSLAQIDGIVRTTGAAMALSLCESPLRVAAPLLDAEWVVGLASGAPPAFDLLGSLCEGNAIGESIAESLKARCVETVPVNAQATPSLQSSQVPAAARSSPALPEALQRWIDIAAGIVAADVPTVTHIAEASGAIGPACLALVELMGSAAAATGIPTELQEAPYSSSVGLFCLVLVLLKQQQDQQQQSPLGASGTASLIPELLLLPSVGRVVETIVADATYSAGAASTISLAAAAAVERGVGIAALTILGLSLASKILSSLEGSLTSNDAPTIDAALEDTRSVLGMHLVASRLSALASVATSTSGTGDVESGGGMSAAFLGSLCLPGRVFLSACLRHYFSALAASRLISLLSHAAKARSRGDSAGAGVWGDAAQQPSSSATSSSSSSVKVTNGELQALRLGAKRSLEVALVLRPRGDVDGDVFWAHVQLKQFPKADPDPVAHASVDIWESALVVAVWAALHIDLQSAIERSGAFKSPAATTATPALVIRQQAGGVIAAANSGVIGLSGVETSTAESRASAYAALHSARSGAWRQVQAIASSTNTLSAASSSTIRSASSSGPLSSAVSGATLEATSLANDVIGGECGTVGFHHRAAAISALAATANRVAPCAQPPLSKPGALPVDHDTSTPPSDDAAATAYGANNNAGSAGVLLSTFLPRHHGVAPVVAFFSALEVVARDLGHFTALCQSSSRDVGRMMDGDSSTTETPSTLVSLYPILSHVRIAARPSLSHQNSPFAGSARSRVSVCFEPRSGALDSVAVMASDHGASFGALSAFESRPSSPTQDAKPATALAAATAAPTSGDGGNGSRVGGRVRTNGDPGSSSYSLEDCLAYSCLSSVAWLSRVHGENQLSLLSALYARVRERGMYARAVDARNKGLTELQHLAHVAWQSGTSGYNTGSYTGALLAGAAAVPLTPASGAAAASGRRTTSIGAREGTSAAEMDGSACANVRAAMSLHKSRVAAAEAHTMDYILALSC